MDLSKSGPATLRPKGQFFCSISEATAFHKRFSPLYRVRDVVAAVIGKVGINGWEWWVEIRDLALIFKPLIDFTLKICLVKIKQQYWQLLFYVKLFFKKAF